MDKKIAKKVTKAIVSIGHPLLDFRSKEAKVNVKWIRKYLKPYIFKNCRFLDVGCGTGKQSFAAEELGAEVFGIDCSGEAIKYANRIKKIINSSCRFSVCDYTEISFEREAFDIAIFPKNIIECSYSEIEKLSSGISRILKINGKLVVTMEDGLEKFLGNGKDNIEIYSKETGRFESKITLPNNKKYYYPTYFWTIPFAKHIFSREFKLLEELKIDFDYYALVFIKKQ